MSQTKPKKIFDEKKFQKNRKRLNTIGITWIICVLFIGTVLIITDAISANKASKDVNESITNVIDSTKINLGIESGTETTLESSLIDVSSYNGPKNEDELNIAIEEIKGEHTIGTGEVGWFDDQSAETDEVYALKSEYSSYLSDVKYNEATQRKQLSQTKSGITGAANNIIDSASSAQKKISSIFSGISDVGTKGFSLIGTVFGIITMIVCCLPGIALLFIANSRGIYGFLAQSTIPVFKESTKQMAPAFGSVAREVTKGIKTGLKGTSKKKK